MSENFLTMEYDKVKRPKYRNIRCLASLLGLVLQSYAMMLAAILLPKWDPRLSRGANKAAASTLSAKVLGLMSHKRRHLCCRVDPQAVGRRPALLLLSFLPTHLRNTISRLPTINGFHLPIHT